MIWAFINNSPLPATFYVLSLFIHAKLLYTWWNAWILYWQVGSTGAHEIPTPSPTYSIKLVQFLNKVNQKKKKSVKWSLHCNMTPPIGHDFCIGLVVMSFSHLSYKTDVREEYWEVPSNISRTLLSFTLLDSTESI